MLDLLGLDAVAESVYRAMLVHPQAGVEALRVQLGISEEKIRTALDRLSELALVRPSANDPRQMHAVSPQLGMEMLLAQQQAELAARQQRVEASRAAAVRLISEFAHQKPGAAETDVIDLEGIDEIRDHLVALNSDVKEEFLTFAPGGPQTAANMQASRPLNQLLLERGIRMRTVYLDSIRNDPPTVAHAEWLTSLGGQVRTAPLLPTRMIIYDRRTAVIATDSDNTTVGAVVLSAQGLIAALCALFESVWQTAEPLGAPRRRDAEADPLTPQQSTALRLLAQGYTDETIAKRLGVSTRTARRIATDLMAHLNARSRFQAGAHAVQHGYLSTVPD
ncbi:helix-turn-helix transcriptional regulator [Streptomyces sp. NPDC004647]|uniref:helix-turn-helix transcriptional regulator n=1 Tax=Streptomyces sp. NPDC004647 TaxID=3154671 RepID=UPI0033B17F29